MAAPHVFTRAGAGLRLLRAAVFTAVCVALSALGHSTASGAGVPWWSLGLGFLLVLLAVCPLAGRERSLPGIAALLAAGQLGLHALFGLGQQGMAMGPAPDSAAERAARLVCGAGASSLSPLEAHHILATAGLDDPAAHAHPGMGVLPSLPMLLLHLLAALVAGWLLRHGERSLFGLVRLSGQLLAGVAAGARLRALWCALALVRLRLAALALLRQPRATRGDEERLPRDGAALRHSVIRRGPPRAGLTLAA
ncbi:hypothetical protein RM574_22985 [Streptomyces sp. DSM 41982]|uniref:Integral membrane protein n=2 Tax=Streptomyces TaxID=1883 RepID=A0ABD5EAU8_9ACTN|nr:hypothetical protein [Streptomyces sp. DSM 41982]MDT0418355.1 hypothetical protein [Streptomyces sp. DSM 41982]